MNAAPPQALAALLMRRAAWVLAAVLLVALVLGMLRLRLDVDDEVHAADRLARMMALLGQAHGLDDDTLLARLRAVQASGRLRHLSLWVQGGDGRLLLSPEPARAVPAEGAATAVWSLRRPAGADWQVRLLASAEDEQREALVDLLLTLGLLLLAAVGLLLCLRLNLRLALRPLGALLQAISGIGTPGGTSLRALPSMPVRELAAIVTALDQLQQAWFQAREESRQLERQLIGSQEGERARIAAELHDELGQGLTAMRVEVAHLLRSLPEANPTPTRVQAQGLMGHCERMQREVRSLLAGLQPLGPGLGPDAPVETPDLHRLLEQLVSGWDRRSDEAGPRFALHWAETGPTVPVLARSLGLLLYRITQEALTNVARHAQAHEVRVSLCIDAARAQVQWRLCDDGVGLTDVRQAMRQGSGLAGIHQRVFAAGGDLVVSAVQPGSARPGLCLAACLPLR